MDLSRLDADPLIAFTATARRALEQLECTAYEMLDSTNVKNNKFTLQIWCYESGTLGEQVTRILWSRK